MIEKGNSLVLQRNYTLPRGFGKLVKEFLDKSKEQEANVEQVENQILDIIDADKGAFWTIWQHEELSGYFYASIMPGEFGGIILLIHEVMSRIRSSSVLQAVDATLESFGHSKGAQAMAFFTRRNPHAFLRRLGARWEIDSIVLMKRVRSI